MKICEDIRRDNWEPTLKYVVISYTGNIRLTIYLLCYQVREGKCTRIKNKLRLSCAKLRTCFARIGLALTNWLRGGGLVLASYHPLSLGSQYDSNTLPADCQLYYSGRAGGRPAGRPDGLELRIMLLSPAVLGLKLSLATIWG